MFFLVRFALLAMFISSGQLLSSDSLGSESDSEGEIGREGLEAGFNVAELIDELANAKRRPQMSYLISPFVTKILRDSGRDLKLKTKLEIQKGLKTPKDLNEYVEIASEFVELVNEIEGLTFKEFLNLHFLFYSMRPDKPYENYELYNYQTYQKKLGEDDFEASFNKILRYEVDMEARHNHEILTLNLVLIQRFLVFAREKIGGANEELSKLFQGLLYCPTSKLPKKLLKLIDDVTASTEMNQDQALSFYDYLLSNIQRVLETDQE